MWVDKYGDSLFHFAFLKLHNREAAEDIIQDTFIAALNSIPQFRGDCQEKTWLFSILRHKIIDYLNLTQKRPFVELNENFYGYYFNEKDNDHFHTHQAPKEWQCNDDVFETEEFNATIQQCLQKLPSGMVDVFIAKYLEEEDPSVIQRKFELSSSNYWVLLHRAKLGLRACIEKFWFAL